MVCMYMYYMYVHVRVDALRNYFCLVFGFQVCSLPQPTNLRVTRAVQILQVTLMHFPVIFDAATFFLLDMDAAAFFF